MSCRQTFAVVTISGPVVEVSGYKTGEVMRAYDLKPMWSRRVGKHGGWVLDRKHADDVIAMLEYWGYRVRTSGVAA